MKTTLLQRIQWVLKHREALIKNESQWSLAAKKTRTRVNTLMRRLEEEPDHKVETETLQALAEAASVSISWFAYGEGSPDSGIMQLVERYQEMPAVRNMARAQGFDEEFVRTWEAHLDADEDPDADYLWTLMKAAYARHIRKAPKPPGDPLDGLDDPPKR